MELQEILREEGVETFDALLVTDGSGSAAKDPGGWACLVYEPTAQAPVLTLCGGGTYCSVNFAELMAVVHGLDAYMRLLAKRGAPAACRTVVVLTDSTYVAQGDAAHGDANCLLRGMLREASRRGYEIKFIHRQRETTEANKYVDALSKRARAAIKEMG